MKHLEQLGRFVAGLTYDAIPEDARRAARFQLADMVAAVFAAGRAHEVDSVREAVASFAPKGRATFLATGERFGPTDAALANAAYSMAQDFDDIVWMGHTCHSAVFASLAVAEHEEKTTRDLVCAIVAANEIGGRLGASSLLGPLNGQMWTFIHLAGAAAGAAKLLGLDAERTTHALAIALAQPNFALQPGFLLPGSKLLAASTPTATGIQAAYFARAGMTGFPGILEDRRGFWQRFSFLPLPSMLGELGEVWITESLAIKTYPGCHYFQTAFSALDRIRARATFAAGDVRSVRVETTQLAREATRFASEYVASSGLSAVAINFDLALSIAVLLHATRLSPAELDPAWLAANGDAVQALASRIEVVHDPELSAQVVACVAQMKAGRGALRSIGPRDVVALARRYRSEYRSTLVTPGEAIRFAAAARRALRKRRSPGPIVLPVPNRVIVELAGGRRQVEQVDVPVGTFALAGCEGELRRKFVDQASHRLGDRAAPAFDALMHVEERALGDLVSALA